MLDRDEIPLHDHSFREQANKTLPFGEVKRIQTDLKSGRESGHVFEELIETKGVPLLGDELLQTLTACRAILLNSLPARLELVDGQSAALIGIHEALNLKPELPVDALRPGTLARHLHGLGAT